MIDGQQRSLEAAVAEIKTADRWVISNLVSSLARYLHDSHRVMILLSLIISLSGNADSKQLIEEGKQNPSIGSWAPTITGCLIWLPGLLNGYDVLKVGIHLTWTGKCRSGYASGLGTLDFQGVGGHDIIHVTMENGKMSGQGDAMLSSGDRILANFRDGLIDGNVTYMEKDGTIYEGGWSNGHEEGNGKAEFPNGIRYNGQWHQGQESGLGIMHYPNGMVYRGHWQEGMRDGYGVLLDSVGDKYEGNWQNGKESGHGVTTSFKGDRYEGDFENSKREGIGTFLASNGDKYIGTWGGGVPNGAGILTKSGGEIYKGIWTRGCLRINDHAISYFVPPASCNP